MQESRSTPAKLVEQTGMDWLSGTIRALAKSFRLSLFSHELENCTSDKNLQALPVRLINLVRFIAAGKTKCP